MVKSATKAGEEILETDKNIDEKMTEKVETTQEKLTTNN